MSGIVYTPQPDHRCAPPRADKGGVPATAVDFPPGTVWECDCHTTWVSRGVTGGGRQPTGGYAAGGLEWKRETGRARRKRERQGITPEQVFGTKGATFTPIPVSSLPTEIATPSLAAQVAADLAAAATEDHFGHGRPCVLLDPQDVSTVFDPETEQLIGYVYYPPNVAARGTEPERIRHPIGILAAIDAGHRRFAKAASNDTGEPEQIDG